MTESRMFKLIAYHGFEPIEDLRQTEPRVAKHPCDQLLRDRSLFISTD